MNVLGITNDIDAGAALAIDGRVIAAVNEERFSRIKLDDRFPTNSIQFVLQEAGIKIEDADIVSYAWGKILTDDDFLTIMPRAFELVAKNPSALETVSQRIRMAVLRDRPKKNEMWDWVISHGLENRFEIYDHHEAHAASAFYTSPYERALVFTIDGRGNLTSGSVYLGEGTQMTKLAETTMFDSLGYFYGAITNFLGFKHHRHEGKVTGLAAYGNPEPCLPIMREMVGIMEGKIQGFVGKYFKPFFDEHLPSLEAALRHFCREDIAAAAQAHLEDVVTSYIRPFVARYQIPFLCLAGGVFANVKLNMSIRELPEVEQIYVHPNMGDGGLGLGSVMLTLARRKITPVRPLQHVYLGPAYPNQQIEEVLRRYGLPYRQVKDKSFEAVRQLRAQRVLGWFQGRMEYGPRALGSRSILYPARDHTVNDWLNKRLRRSEFMPFAPVITDQLAPSCFFGWHPNDMSSKFMTVCYRCTPLMLERCPAVVHVDGTARPQVVSREDNPDYYDVVARYCAETGEPCLINTSFNEHEQPIVCSPEDALDSLLGDNIDVLIIGDFLVESPGAGRYRHEESKKLESNPSDHSRD